MGHLPIVNKDTLCAMIEKGRISTGGSLKSMWIKTTSDIFSDVLAVRAGDKVFPWIIKGEQTENVGFKYVFEVAGKPYFASNEEYPVCVPLRSEGYEYEIPVSEAEALDLWGRELLWNAIGKKSLGRGRSLTHQTPMEDQKLIKLLDKKNPGGPKKICIGNIMHNFKDITINTLQNDDTVKIQEDLEDISEDKRLSHLNISMIPWVRNNIFRTEKTLEAWIMENIDGLAASELVRLGFYEGLKMSWFGNYLPFGVQGSNIDVIVIQEDTSKTIVNVMELKVNDLNDDTYIATVNQVVDYALFVKDAFTAFGQKVDLNTVILSGQSNKPRKIVESKGMRPKWIDYYINEDGVVKFRRLV